MARHKQLAWDKDPAILERLPVVQRFWLAGWSTRQIATVVKIDHATVAKDIKRVQTLLAREATEDLKRNRDKSLAMLREIKQMAHQAFLETKDSSLNKSAYLNVMKGCEEDIIKIQGTAAPAKQEISGPQGKPLEIKIEETDASIGRFGAIINILSEIGAMLPGTEVKSLPAPDTEAN